MGAGEAMERMRGRLCINLGKMQSWERRRIKPKIKKKKILYLMQIHSYTENKFLFSALVCSAHVKVPKADMRSATLGS